MKKLLFIPMLAIVLAACSSFGGGQTALATCEAYDSALRTLAVMRDVGDLSDSQIATVERWRPILNDVCLQGTPPEGSAGLGTLEAGLLALARTQGGS